MRSSGAKTYWFCQLPGQAKRISISAHLQPSPAQVHWYQIWEILPYLIMRVLRSNESGDIFYFIFFSLCRAYHFFIYLFFFISWRLIILQYCSGFCHTLTRISHGFTCVPHPNPPSHLPLHPIPLGLPSAPGPSTCLMHPTWAGDLFHPR